MTFEHGPTDGGCGTHDYTDAVVDEKPGHIRIECPNCGMDGMLTKQQINDIDGIARCAGCMNEVKILK